MKTNPEPTTSVDIFLEAALAHAGSMLAEKGAVHDVMILGRYEGQELLFVFPSGQDRAQYASACQQQAEEFGADLAMMVADGQLTMTRTENGVNHEDSAPCALIFWRERAGPTRAQYALINGAALGPVNSMLGVQTNEFIDSVFPTTIH